MAVLEPLLQALLQPLPVALWVVSDMACCHRVEPHSVLASGDGISLYTMVKYHPSSNTPLIPMEQQRGVYNIP